MTQQELLDRLVERGIESKADLVDSFREGWEGLSSDEIEALLSPTFSTGGETSGEDVDRILYDERQS